MRISIIKGDITRLRVDAIVNAANPMLGGGGGVDGAIHAAAGPKLEEECRRILRRERMGGLPTGEAIITPGYDLPAKYVIHTVGPVYGRDDLALLGNCYVNSLRIAEENNCTSIAFPSISTGSYGVPVQTAVKIVSRTLYGYAANVIMNTVLVLHSDRDYSIYCGEFGGASVET